ncbi:MAG: YraN family protein [Defluviitaleaceae bacterium]|nr:YraN family protein [Defluviitaleaceae bacterium]
MNNKYKAGLSGQEAAEKFLLNKGYQVLARNYRIKSGEVDLILQHDNYIVFVEVKFRTSLSYGLPREAVGHTKQKRIINTALHYLARHKLSENDIRFDVVEVLEQHGQLYASHIENAFMT